MSILENLCALSSNLVDSPLGTTFREVPKVEGAELESTNALAGFV